MAEEMPVTKGLNSQSKASTNFYDSVPHKALALAAATTTAGAHGPYERRAVRAHSTRFGG